MNAIRLLLLVLLSPLLIPSILLFCLIDELLPEGRTSDR